MRAVVRPSMLLAGVFLFGCASSTPVAWRRVTTAHFVVETDLDERAAVETAKELEISRDALISAAWPNFEFPETVRTDVFALADGAEFHRLFGPNLAGMFTHASVRGSVCLSGPPDNWVRGGSSGAMGSTLRHEIAHQLAAAVFPALPPRWFNEGLATLLETVRITRDRASVVIGRPNGEQLSQVSLGETITLRRLLDWSEHNNALTASQVAGLYSKSWLLFFWLYQKKQEPFARYQEALAKGTEPEAAWASEFSELDADFIDGELSAYARGGEFDVRSMPLRRSQTTIVHQLLSPADTHVARAKVGFIANHEDGPVLEEAKREVRRALELDATNVQALRLDTWSPVAERMTTARRALAAHPHDGWAYVLVSDILNATSPDSDEQEAMRRRAVALLPGEPEVLSLLAWTLLRRDKTKEALPLALRATQAAPHDPGIADVAAMVLLGVGRCNLAVNHARRALAFARDGNPVVRERAAQDLWHIRSRCGSNAAPRAP
jgi:tetratricopeptide (TPR) repeat protein